MAADDIFLGYVDTTNNVLVLANDVQAANLASASTTDIGAARGQYVKVTGTTTITALGTVQAGTLRIVEFTGALTLTHNGTSLILPGAANIATQAGDVGFFVSEGSGNWRCVHFQRAAFVAARPGRSSRPSPARRPPARP
jgi:ethanolamine utilization microcompartment shell protein EutS